MLCFQECTQIETDISMSFFPYTKVCIRHKVSFNNHHTENKNFCLLAQQANSLIVNKLAIIFTVHLCTGEKHFRLRKIEDDPQPYVSKN